MRSLVSYWYPVEKHVCIIASQCFSCFALFFHKVKKTERERETPGELDKGHAKPHYHRGTPMSCKKSLVVLGKEGKWVMLLGHKGKMERDWCLGAQTTEGWSGRGDHESPGIV